MSLLQQPQAWRSHFEVELLEVPFQALPTLEVKAKAKQAQALAGRVVEQSVCAVAGGRSPAGAPPPPPQAEA